jgi:hypothetical protein
VVVFFGSIPHTELMKSVARRVVDRRVLHLIKMRNKPVRSLILKDLGLIWVSPWVTLSGVYGVCSSVLHSMHAKRFDISALGSCCFIGRQRMVSKARSSRYPWVL